MAMSNRISNHHNENIELQSEIVRLQQALKESQARSQAKSSVLANIAHELRTPLNTIIGFSQILGRHTQLSGEQQEYINLVLNSSEHMLALIDNILHMTSIESGKAQLKTSEFNLYDLIEDLTAIYQSASNEKGLGFHLEISEMTPCFLIADRNKIRQILSNFLSNALKFTEKGMIRLSVDAKENVDNPDESILSMTVSDTGMGIQPEEVDKIFAPYEQTSSGLLSHEGSGLGLAITKEFVELMNGSLTVQSRWQEGTSFICDLLVTVPRKIQETENHTSQVKDMLDTKEHQVIQASLTIDGLSSELQERLKQAARNYSLEQIRYVVTDFPKEAETLVELILAKANEFDFVAILNLFSADV